MNAEKDYEDLLRLFNRHKVRYCIVGAYAVAFYARPRYTKDMDLLVEPSPANAERVLKALQEFGFRSLKLSGKDLTAKGRIVQLGYEPLRIDLVTSIEGVDFQQVWEHRKQGRYGSQKAFFIGLNELIRNKKKSNRRQDQADIELLRSARRRT